MKASELRIGNIISSKNGSDSVIKAIGDNGGWIEAHSLYDSSEERFDTSIYEITGIPLTEEWLLRFGFGFGLNDEEYEKLNCPIIFDTDWNCYIDREFEKELFIQCEYVHQLQNLYFALTGKELEYK